MTSCLTAGCPRGAAVFPVVLVYAEAGGAPALAEFRGVETCWSCSRKIAVADLVTDERWARIQRAVRGGNRPMARLDRSRSQLRWQHIREARVG